MLIRRGLHCNLPNLLVFCNMWKSSTTNAILPSGSTLHRINEYFTPLVEALPDLDVAAMAHSIQRRGLTSVFQDGFLENLVSHNQVRIGVWVLRSSPNIPFLLQAQQRNRVWDYEKEVENLETERLAVHQQSQEVSKAGGAQVCKLRRCWWCRIFLAIKFLNLV